MVAAALMRSRTSGPRSEAHSDARKYFIDLAGSA